jgi:thioredoxin-like negative regulator of GroEL
MSTVEAGQHATQVKTRSPSRLVLVLVGVGGLAWAGWAWRADQNYRGAIMAIELEMANGRFGIAARELNRLLERVPGDGQAAILLGRCEQERGRFKAAANALAQVAPGSELSHPAILARMRLEHDQGHFAAAEQLITDAAALAGDDAPHTRVLLVPIYSQLGRLDEAQRLLEAWWDRLNEWGEGASERAIDQVRMHIELAFKPNPVSAVRAYLDEAHHRDSNDDRVWLGQAHLAIRTRDFDQALSWLDRCLERRPRDVSVWFAFLSLGVASNRADLVERALPNLPAETLTPAQRHRLAAWLCVRNNDQVAERRQLQRLVALDPADGPALDRLAQLAMTASRTDQAVDLRARKVEIDRLRTRYEKLFDRNQPIRDAEEMAAIAERLGRVFEARGFLTVELAQGPDRADLRQQLARLNAIRGTRPDMATTLAEWLARELSDSRTIDGPPAP